MDFISGSFYLILAARDDLAYQILEFLPHLFSNTPKKNNHIIKRNLNIKTTKPYVHTGERDQ